MCQQLIPKRAAGNGFRLPGRKGVWVSGVEVVPEHGRLRVLLGRVRPADFGPGGDAR